jgi:MFS family permease
MPGLLSSYAALRHRNYRLLWLGQLVSTSGSMMHTTAVLWHVTLLSGGGEKEKGLALALVGASKFLPIAALSLFSGVVADALDRRRLMIACNVLLTLIAGVLAALTFGGLGSAWPVYLLTALSSAVGMFDGPARQALIPQIVPARDLASAISLNAILFQAASVAGPALAGILMAEAGVGWVYAANAASFLAVLAALFAMRDVPAREGEPPRIELAAAVEGIRFVFREPLIRSSMLVDFFATLFASANYLLPIYAQDILDVGERGYGILYSAQAVGALVTSAALASLAPRIDRRGTWLLWSVVLYGLATVGFGLSTSFALSWAFLAVTGAADTVSVVLRNVIRQLATPDRLRGRMTSVNMLFFIGGPQLGEVEAGLVARAFGAPFSVVSGGIACLVSTALIAARSPWLRRYRRPEETEPASEAV